MGNCFADHAAEHGQIPGDEAEVRLDSKPRGTRPAHTTPAEYR